MISYLIGKPLHFSADHFTLLVGGVGYELLSSSTTLSEFEGKEQIEVYVFTHVKEDALQLFGFSTAQEKEIFLSLLKVNGIGPKSALTILSAARLEQLVQMIEEGDAQKLSKLPKIGKKTAEQMILTLQGKLVRVQPIKVKNNEVRTQLLSALVNLGFRLQEIEPTIDQLEPLRDLESGLRAALSALTSNEAVKPLN